MAVVSPCQSGIPESARPHFPPVAGIGFRSSDFNNFKVVVKALQKLLFWQAMKEEQLGSGVSLSCRCPLHLKHQDAVPAAGWVRQRMSSCGGISGCFLKASYKMVLK